MDLSEIVGAVRASLEKRDSRRDILAAKIVEIAEPAMAAARVRVLELDIPDGGKLEYRVPKADCSQWGNRMDHPGHHGEPALMLTCGLTMVIDVRSLGPVPDVGFWDGRNMQHQQGPTLDARTGRTLRPATVEQLRAVARALPAALAALLAETQERAEREAGEADEALTTL